MKTKTAASFVASTMGAGLIAGALMAAPAEAVASAKTTAPVVQSVGNTTFVSCCGCGWRRRCCRCARCGCGWRSGCGWRGGCGWRSSWRWSSWDSWW